MYMVAAVVEIMTAVSNQYCNLWYQYQGGQTVVWVEHELGSWTLEITYQHLACR